MAWLPEEFGLSPSWGSRVEVRRGHPLAAPSADQRGLEAERGEPLQGHSHVARVEFDGPAEPARLFRRDQCGPTAGEGLVPEVADSAAVPEAADDQLDGLNRGMKLVHLGADHFQDRVLVAASVPEPLATLLPTV